MISSQFKSTIVSRSDSVITHNWNEKEQKSYLIIASYLSLRNRFFGDVSSFSTTPIIHDAILSRNLSRRLQIWIAHSVCFVIFATSSIFIRFLFIFWYFLILQIFIAFGDVFTPFCFKKIIRFGPTITKYI